MIPVEHLLTVGKHFMYQDTTADDYAFYKVLYIKICGMHDAGYPIDQDSLKQFELMVLARLVCYVLGSDTASSSEDWE